MTLQSIGGDSDGSEAASHLQLDKHAEHKVWTGRLQLLSAFSETSGADDVPTRSISVRIRRKNGVCFDVRSPIEVWGQRSTGISRAEASAQPIWCAVAMQTRWDADHSVHPSMVMLKLLPVA